MHCSIPGRRLLIRRKEKRDGCSRIPEGSHVYYVHSYYLRAEDPSIVTARSEYGIGFDASIECGNVFACQFHPEKSERIGMQILRNFLQVNA